MQNRLFVLLLFAAGLILRLVIAPFGGHPGDLPVITGWAAALAEHGWLAIYAVSDANYPPLGMLLIAATRGLFGLIAPGAELTFSGLWPTLLKLPAIFADLGIGWLVWRMAADHRGRWWITAGVVFNPALILLSAWWGQLESVYALAALAATWSAVRRRPLWAGVWLAAGMLVKPQALTVAPLVALALLTLDDEPAGFRQVGSTFAAFTAGLLIPILVCLGPFALTGQLELVLLRSAALVAGPGWPTVNAANLWYLVTGGAGNWAYNVPLRLPDSTPVVAGLTMRQIGLGLLALWTAAVLWLAWRSGSVRIFGQPYWIDTREPPATANAVSAPLRKGGRIVANTRVRAAMGGFILSNEGTRRGWPLAGALLYLGVFFWPTQAHERYAFGAVVLLAGCVALSRLADRRSAALYAIITAAHTLNLLWAAPSLPWLNGFAGSTGVGLALAGIFALGGLWGMIELARLGRRRYR